VRTVRAILHLTRLDTCLLGFLATFIPLLVRTNDLALSFVRAIPLLFICICTFIANALDDVERDLVNHPERPLPARDLTPTFAAVLYFTSLALALFLTSYYVAPDIAFLYYALVTLSISYSYIVDYLPILKVPYVAAAISVPVLIVAAWYPDESKIYVVAGSVFLFALGRETCMDINDRAGDKISFMHRFRPRPLAVAAFSLQTLGLLLLATQVSKLREIVDLLVMTSMLALAGIYWFKFAKYKRAIILMKIQFLLGLLFLT
jgi:geranylgeranylglycerol-phosphate geranylgeranyltransferase